MNFQFEFRNNSILYYVLTLEPDQFFIETDELATSLSFYPVIKSPIGLSNDYVVLIGGSWGIGNTNSTSIPNRDIPIQPLIPNRPVRIPLTHELFKVIESIRIPQKDIFINIHLFISCDIPLDYYRQRSTSHHEGFIDNDIELLKGKWKVLTVHQPTLIRISREKWSNILQEADYKSYRLVEIPNLNLSNRQEKRWTKVLDQFEKVLQLERVGDYEICIQQSRILVEEVVSVIAGKFNYNISSRSSGDIVNSLLSKLTKEYPFEEDLIQSFASTLRAINYLSRSHHHAGSRPTLFGNTRMQSEHIIFLCTTTLSMVSAILEWEYQFQEPE